MKKYFFLSLIILLPFFTEAKSLWAFLTYSTFNSPDGPYVETYLSIAGNSVIYVKKDNGKFQATVDIIMTFKLGNDIKAFKKYELKSPEIDDTTKNNYEFIDEQRFQIPNGSYNFEIQLADRNKQAKLTPFSQPVVIDFPEGTPGFSGIEFIKSYTKNETPNILTKSGYDLIPYVYNFFPQVDSKMTFYCEYYNLDKVMQPGQKYILTYYLESFENNLKLNEYARVRVENAKPVGVLLAEFNIENLATGNYNLVVEVRDQKNEVVASKKIFFQRSNPNAKLSYAEMTSFNSTNTFAERITNLDTLKENISCTYPISGGIERAFIKSSLKSSDIKTLQQYFYGFWQRRDPANPEKAWLAYREQVKKANYNFGTPVKKGYQTDRGRVFLEYGPPNTRSQQYSEPSTYPYEIWQYYTLNNNQRNKKFVFYSPDMVTSDFFILHSDAIGEINNPRWQIDLQSRTYTPRSIDDTQPVNSYWGDFAKDYWDLPN